jgi:hypothetical protein
VPCGREGEGLHLPPVPEAVRNTNNPRPADNPKTIERRPRWSQHPASNEHATPRPVRRGRSTFEAHEGRHQFPVVASRRSPKRFYGGWLRLTADFATPDGFACGAADVSRSHMLDSVRQWDSLSTRPGLGPGSLSRGVRPRGRTHRAHPQRRRRERGVCHYAGIRGPRFRARTPRVGRTAHGRRSAIRTENGWLIQEIKTRLPVEDIGITKRRDSDRSLARGGGASSGEYEATASEALWSGWVRRLHPRARMRQDSEEAAKDAALHMESARHERVLGSRLIAITSLICRPESQTRASVAKCRNSSRGDLEETMARETYDKPLTRTSGDRSVQRFHFPKAASYW